MTVHYRLADEADVEALTHLIALSASELGAGYYCTEQLCSALEYVFGVDRQLIADATYYVAEDRGRDGSAQLVGCGGWSRRRRMLGKDCCDWNAEAAQLLDPRIEPARIRAFFVHPARARQGIARELLARCESAARLSGFRSVELASTLMGEPLYRRCGYIQLERVNYELPDGLHLPVVRMLKALDAAQTATLPGS